MTESEREELEQETLTLILACNPASNHCEDDHREAMGQYIATRNDWELGECARIYRAQYARKFAPAPRSVSRRFFRRKI